MHIVAAIAVIMDNRQSSYYPSANNFIIFNLKIVIMLGLAIYIFVMIIFFSNIDNNKDSSETKH